MSNTRTNRPRISIICPVKNEARNLELLLPRIPPVHEIIVIDGQSLDDSVAVVRRLRPEARVLNQTRRGKGNALVCGFEAATGDILIMLDADGSADPAEIPRFVAALRAGADFAKGSRFCAGGGSDDITRLRQAGNLGLNVLANNLIRARYTDLCYGYNAFWADILPVLDLPSSRISTVPPAGMVWGDGFEIETVINCRIAAAGLAITEVPSFERARVHGDSNLNTFSDGMRVLRTIRRERGRRALQRALAERHLVLTSAPVEQTWAEQNWANENIA